MAILGNFSEPKARQIGCDDPIAIGQSRHQLPELKGGRRKAVQQEHHGSIRRAGFTIEDRHPISRDAAARYFRPTGCNGRAGRLSASLALL